MADETITLLWPVGPNEPSLIEAAGMKACGAREAGGRAHREYWMPAEDLDAFNSAIVGEIEVAREFH